MLLCYPRKINMLLLLLLVVVVSEKNLKIKRTSNKNSRECHSQNLQPTLETRRKWRKIKSNVFKINKQLQEKNEPRHDKTNKMSVRPAKTQISHPPSLIRVFAVRMKKPWVLSYPLSAQRRLWSDWADAKADLSLRWAHSHIVGFVISRLKYRPSELITMLNSRLKRSREQGRRQKSTYNAS